MRASIVTPARVRTWVLAALALAATTAGMVAVRASLDKAHVALVFLLIVLVGSAVGGRVLGLVLAVVAFLLFDYLFLPPYGTIVVTNPLDWLVLVAFLLTSVVATQLLSRAQERAEVARRHAAEVERLAALGAEALNAARADDALRTIAEVIQSALSLGCCEIYLRRPSAGDAEAQERVPLERVAQAGDGCADAAPEDDVSLAAWVGAHGLPAMVRVDGLTHVAPQQAVAQSGPALGAFWLVGGGVRTLLLPLRVRERTVGVLRAAGTPAIALRADQRQFLDALAYYAALGVERLRLTAEAAHAEALREADRLKNALLAAVSHDLRTPLTTIKALAGAIEEEGASVGDARAVSIEEEADRLGRVVGDLLDLSRLMGGALALSPEVNAAEDLVGAVRQRVAGVLHGREIQVHAGPASGDGAQAPMLLGRFDFVHALRALGNLVENALKYGAPGTPVELDVDRDGPMLLFRVSDRGPGVPEAERERIFEPFYRPPGVPADIGGSGLGLTIARGLAEAQGGDVRYEPRPGGGSVFSLRLPAVEGVGA
ncbi:MAG TPA: ATP-binding protein [Gemmatimonadaceae bacterium]|jgi:two-component system sensor histidine kinase KdpD